MLCLIRLPKVETSVTLFILILIYFLALTNIDGIKVFNCLNLSMKSILVVLGAFLFSIFVEGFSRVIVIIYHQQEFSMFGISSLPGIEWVVILYFAVLATGWISGMLTVTITGFAPGKHLIALGILMLLWRASEIIQLFGSEPTWYLLTLPLASVTALILAYKTHRISNEPTSA